MKKAKSFKKWYMERVGHSAQIVAAKDAIDELEKNMCIYARENIDWIDFDSDEQALQYFADFAANYN